MRYPLRSLVCLLGCAAGLAGCGAVGGTGDVSSRTPSSAVGGSEALSSIGSPMVVSDVQMLDGGQQLRDAERSRLLSPEATVAREVSRSAFRHMSAASAAKLAKEAFPAVVDRPDGGMPALRSGERVVRYLSPYVAQLSLPGGRHGVADSLGPIARQTSPGHYAPVNLALSDVGDSYVPESSVVAVRIPKQLSASVTLPDSGVSVTPVDSSGTPLEGSRGALDGVSVIYANTQTDTDTLVKPTAMGFKIDALLRSVDSPSELHFKIEVPQGGRLSQDTHAGLLRIVREGRTIGVVPRPAAQDAAGTLVPVSMSVSGDLLTVSVAHGSSDLQYPVEVDPEYQNVWDTYLTGYGHTTNWLFCTSYSSECKHEEGVYRSKGWGLNGYLTAEATGTYQTPKYSEFYYHTQGESHIYEMPYSTEESNNEADELESYIKLENDRGEKESLKLLSVSKNASEENTLSCCAPGAAENHNHAAYVQASLANPGNHFTDTLKSVSVRIEQEVSPTIAYDTTDEKLTIAGAKWENVLDGENKWMGPNEGAVGFTAKETGMGVARMRSFHEVEHIFYDQSLLNEGTCAGDQCPQTATSAFTYNSVLPNGHDQIWTGAFSAAGNFSEVGATVNVDGEKPSGLAVSGLPAGNTINEAQYQLRAEAVDGKAPTPSSGIKSLQLTLDGFVLPATRAGTCTPGPCAATGEWTINGETFGAGTHTLKLIAVDNAKNEETKTYNITVRHASPMPAGPGSVDPITGSFTLGASDVSIGDGQGTLGVSRSFNSRQLTAGESGPLGPQWKLSVSGGQEIIQQPEGGVVLIAPDGSPTTFQSNGKGGFTSPQGDENLVLEAEKVGETIKAYLLKNSTLGTTVKYTQPSGSTSTSPWVVTSSEGVLASRNGEKETFTWERLEVEGKKIDEPKQVLAPVPAGVTCTELKKGCRALKFIYGTTTKATGEAPSEWGEYNGRLKQVLFVSYNTSTKAMTEPAVAEYAYDKQGRLRAEWDPRISPALKITYGYDAASRVVASSPPGQEPWLFHYGTTVGDPSAGRLLSFMRPAASTAIGSGAAPANTVVPTLSTTSPVIGTTLSVSTNGTWSNSPLAYNYSWQDCYTYESKETCTVIPGAVNQSYTPQARDAGYTLRGVVTAVNADGATDASSAASSALAETAPSYLRKWGEFGTGGGQFTYDAATAVDASGNVWVADYSNARVQEFSGTGTFMKMIGWGVSDGKSEFQTCTSTCRAGISGTGNGQFTKPRGIAINPSTGNVYVVDQGNNRIEEFKSTGEFIRTFGESGSEPGKLSLPWGVAIAPSSGNVWIGDYSNNRVDMFSETGTYLGSFGSEGSTNGKFKNPNGIAFSGGNAYVVDTGNNRVQEFSMSGEFVAKFGSKGVGNGQFESPDAIATDPVSGDLYVSDYFNYRIEEFNPAGTFVFTFGKHGSGNGEIANPESVAVNSTGYVYVADAGNNRMQEFEPKYSTNNPLPEPPALGTGTVNTIDYNVPLEGSELHTMTKVEVEKWGEHDDPTEATAVFPADAPMGWPAKYYKRATVSYFDSLGRSVNVATPFGGVSTVEYNSFNEVTRSLTADNRAKALTEANPKEASELLDKKNKYSPLLPPYGTVLQEARGPQHTIRLANGTEKLARDHVRYYYDEGAPESQTYDLVTKKIDSAEYEKKDWEERETVMSYSGQENLGWLLRKPTSVTADPNGLKVTTRTMYNPTTGGVAEVITPEGKNTHSGPYTPSLSIGSEGTGNGQFKSPKGIGVDTKGNVWVADTGNNRLQEFNEKGEYLTQIKPTAESGHPFSGPRGVAFATIGGGTLWAADTGNKRLQTYNEKNEYAGSKTTESEPYGVALETGIPWDIQPFHVPPRVEDSFESWGTEGNGNGQLKGPRGVALDSEKNVWIADTGNNRVQEFTKKGEFLKVVPAGTGENKLVFPEGIAVDSKNNVWVANSEVSHIQEYNHSGEFLTSFGKEGSGYGLLKNPAGVAVDSKGRVWVVDTGNNRVVEYEPGGGSHAAQTIDYTAGENAAYPACGEHPEWAELVCQTQLAAQPGTAGLPEMPVVTDTYNTLDEPETVTEKFGATTRTKKMTYDTAGRLTSTEQTSTVGTSLPKVADEYSSTTGALKSQTTTVGETTQTVKSYYDKLGRLEEYIDADGNKTTYTYEIDGQVEEVNDPKGKQILSYDSTTKALTKLTDSTVTGAFTASYDAEGQLVGEAYPNAMSAKYTISPSGRATGIEYEKTAHCKVTCPEVWFKETTLPSIHGEMLLRSSSLSKEEYTYDNLGRLTQTQEIPVGKGCKTRIYGYNEDSDRTSTISRESATETCATTGGTTLNNSYDTADRLVDTGVSYDAFGNKTKVPAVDAESNEITATFYVSNQTRSQTQNGETLTYYTDPAGRTREIVSTGTTNSTAINHYPGPGEGISWINEGGENYTREIPGIDGSLTATKKNAEAAVLQLHDLQGNVVATAAASETETKLLSSYNSTEFGVPVNGAPPTKYSWLGATGLAPELPSGVTASSGGSYVPQLGQLLQTQPVVPPGAPAPNGIPISPYISSMTPEDYKLDSADAAQAPAREAAREKVAEEEAIRKALEEGVDPDKLLYFTLSEAEHAAAGFGNLSLDAEIGEAISLLQAAGDLGDVAIGQVIGYFTSERIEYWLKAFGSMLSECVDDLKESHHPGGACRVVMPYFGLEVLGHAIIKTKLPYFFKLPTVSWCKGWDGEHVHWCTLEHYYPDTLEA